MVFHQQTGVESSRSPSARARKTNLRPSNELVDLGIKLIQAAEDLVGLDAAITHRDGLLIGFLALIPLRRRNLADLVLERTLVREGATWIVAFGEDDTKTHAPFEIGLPDVLRAPLEAYLEQSPAGPDSRGPVAGPVLSRARYGSPRMARR